MEIMTVALIVVTFVLLPLPTRVTVTVNLTKREITLKAKLYSVRLIKGKFTLSDGQLHFNGTVNFSIELLNFDVKSGLDLTKCFTLRGLYVVNHVNPMELASVKLFGVVNAVSAAAVEPICHSTHTRVNVQNYFTDGDSTMEVSAHVTSSILETIIGLIKQWRVAKNGLSNQ
jgi:hypothetical protein